ncbi:hypothetical protein NKR23_g11415 [Pleurostoma richardsiae]|uniref:Bacteriophage T5 Orf172 DNA-binding domain-containing protein n=1 Tax=Pleurostoma richardsiae TaxID=41990 RepID=A0AA38RAR2_9PEZI|nr:hypothetical protein NKR23_g11415 [Pleurostoma richardsiae]
MESYLVKKGKSSLCGFKSYESLQSLLGISSRCGFVLGGKGSPHENRTCTRSVEQWKQKKTVALLTRLAVVEVPSTEANDILEVLAQHRLCDICQHESFEDSETFIRYCSGISKSWREKTWWEYLVANGMEPQEAFDLMPTAFNLADWEHLLKALSMDPCTSTVTKAPTLPTRGKTASVPRREREVRQSAGLFSVPSESDDVFGDQSARRNDNERVPDIVTQSDSKRPPLPRETATADVPKLRSAGKLNSLGRHQVSNTKELGTSKKTQLSPADYSSSPASFFSSDAASVFDVDDSHVDTPATNYETSPAEVDGDPKVRDRQAYLESPTKHRSRGVPVSKLDSASNDEEVPSSATSQRLSARSRGEQSQPRTSFKPLVDEQPAIAVVKQAEEKPEDQAETVHVFEKLKDEKNLFLYGLAALKKAPEGDRRIPGYVYCYRHMKKEHEGYLKIGYARCLEKKTAFNPLKLLGKAVPVYNEPKSHSPNEVPSEVLKRHNYYINTCNYDIIPVFSYPMLYGAGKMEILVHAELRAYKYRVKNCNPSVKPKPCSRKHEEWFRVSEDVARETVLRWQRFSQSRPYDEHGSLTRRWAARVEEARRLGTGLDFGCWMEEQLAEEKLAEEKLAREKLAEEKLAEEKLAVEKLAKEKLAKEKLAEENAFVKPKRASTLKIIKARLTIKRRWTFQL